MCSVEKITLFLFYFIFLNYIFLSHVFAVTESSLSADETYQIALKQFQKNPKNWTVRQELIQSLIHLEKRKEALVLYAEWMPHASLEKKKFISENAQRLARLFFREEPQARYLEGLHFLMNKKYTEALSRFTQAIKDEPDHLEILMRMGQAYFFLSDDANALATFEAASSLAPWDPQISKWLARSYSHKGSYKKAIPIFEEIKASPLRLKEQSEFIILWYAEALWNSGKRKQALAVLESHSQEYAYHLEILLRLARYRIEIAINDKELLNTSKKNLQLVLSRLPLLVKEPEKLGSDEIDRLLYDFDKLKINAEQLIEVVEQRLSKNNLNSP